MGAEPGRGATSAIERPLAQVVQNQAHSLKITGVKAHRYDGAYYKKEIRRVLTFL